MQVMRSYLFQIHRTPLVRAVVVVATLLAVLALRPLSGGAESDPSLGRDLLALTNMDRTSNGLPALAADARLVEIARERSDDMVTRSYFSYDIPPDGSKVFD